MVLATGGVNHLNRDWALPVAAIVAWVDVDTALGVEEVFEVGHDRDRGDIVGHAAQQPFTITSDYCIAWLLTVLSFGHPRWCGAVFGDRILKEEPAH